MEHGTFQQIGLSKNEADVYQALLKIGEAGVGEISKQSKVHRRNVYDVLNRLLEKGLVFIVLFEKENHYQAVNPNKLTELIGEQKSALNFIMPDLQKIQQNKNQTEEIMIYRGLAGWKRYMRDIIRVGQDVYVIGGKGVWMKEQLKSSLDLYNQEAAQKGITIHLLYDWEVKKEKKEVLEHFKTHKYAFLPPKYSSSSAVDIFGDYVVVVSQADIHKNLEDTLFTVIINQQIADAFRIWFKLMWGLCGKL
ncbi:MAG: helix-turn-helix domain-containing protein [Candidatus Jacksonbacteria bacterium]